LCLEITLPVKHVKSETGWGKLGYACRINANWEKTGGDMAMAASTWDDLFHTVGLCGFGEMLCIVQQGCSLFALYKSRSYYNDREGR